MLHNIQLYNFKKNLVLWSALTIISAYPSFMLGLMTDALIAPMIIGVIIVIIAYSIFTSTAFCQNIINHKKYFAKAIKIAFLIRIMISVIYTLSFFSQDWIFVAIADMYLGIAALAITQLFIDFNFTNNVSFIAILLTTIFQAILVSLALLLLATIIWGIIKILPNKQKNLSHE
jgi:hypothetical protein